MKMRVVKHNENSMWQPKYFYNQIILPEVNI